MAQRDHPASRDAYYWRLFVTGFCFAMFGLAGLVLGLTVFPVLALLPGGSRRHGRRARSVLQYAMRTFVWLMTGMGGMTYEYRGAEKLGRPGQLIVANHPSLIDVIFLIGFTPAAVCVVKAAMWRNPFTRLPVTAAGYVSNATTATMIEGAAEALAAGESVIMFPEGTRTTPGEAMRFHRGAASVAIRAAQVVTPVYIRCEPTAGLVKGLPWYRIPDRRVHLTLEVGEDIDVAPFRSAGQQPPAASRAFNDHLLRTFEQELVRRGLA